MVDNEQPPAMGSRAPSCWGPLRNHMVHTLECHTEGTPPPPTPVSHWLEVALALLAVRCCLGLGWVAESTEGMST